MATPNEKIVNDFCQAWSRKDINEILAFMSDDAVYHNIPLQPFSAGLAIDRVSHR
jgi:limonene-1,2-epoxide hydrolase